MKFSVSGPITQPPKLSQFRKLLVPWSSPDLCARVIKGRSITNRTVNNDWARGGPVTNESLRQVLRKRLGIERDV